MGKTRSERAVKPASARLRKYVGPHSKSGVIAVENVAGRDQVVEFVFPHFSHVCAKTWEPDFGELTLRYLPGDHLIEVKSLQQYLWSFRTVKVFHEEVVSIVLEDLVEIVDPKWMQILGVFPVRSQVVERLIVEHEDPHRTAGLQKLIGRYCFKL